MTCTYKEIETVSQSSREPKTLYLYDSTYRRLPMDPEQSTDLLTALKHVYESNDLDGVVYLDIQKIFFYLRERLDESNEFHDTLNYYWYVDGPNSDDVKAVVSHGKEMGVLSARPTHRTGQGEWISLEDTTALPDEESYPDDLQEVIEAVEKVIEEDYDIFADKTSKIDPIYERAPYEFQRYFKFELRPEIKKFVEGKSWAYDPDELQDFIATAEAYLPLNPEFSEFNDYYSRYQSLTSRYLRTVNPDHADPVLGDRLLTLTDAVWKLFCQQLRIQEHDEAYEEDLDEWEEHYERHKSYVSEDLDSFENRLDVLLEDYPEADKVATDSGWAEIASDFVAEEVENRQ